MMHVHHHHGGRRGGGGGGAALLIGLILIIVIVLMVVPLGGTGMGTGGITPSTIERTPLPPGSAAAQAPLYTDHLGWIRSSTVIETGMRNFFSETGVWPHLYITDTVNDTTTPTGGDMAEYAALLYDSIFQDEASFLLLFHESADMQGFRTHWVAGIQASTVIDAEAADILLDYIDRYYFYGMDEDQFFARAFNDAGQRMMSVTTSPFVMMGWIALGVVAAGLAFLWWMRAKAQKNREMEQAQAILNTPLSELGQGSTGIEDKYE